MTTSRWSLNNTTGGLWTTSANWTAGVPNAAGDTATFDITDVALSGGGAGTRAIDLNGGSQTVGFLHLFGDSTRSWNITNGTLILQPLGGDAFVDYGSNDTVGSSKITATLQFNSGVDFFVDGTGSSQKLFLGNITESGGSRHLEKFGTGSLVLTGNSGYSGTTTIHAGKLFVGDNGTTGTLGSGAVVNNATLLFARSDATTVSNQISGTGDVSVEAGGTVTLSGANTYGAGNFTVVQGGATLKFGHVDAIGQSALAVFAGSTADFNGFAATGVATGAFFNGLTNDSYAGLKTGTLTNSDALNAVNLTANFTGTRVLETSLSGNINFSFGGGGPATLLVSGSLNTLGMTAIGTDATLLLTGNGAATSGIALYNNGVFDINGISSASTTIKDLFVNSLNATIKLGGKSLVVDQADSIVWGTSIRLQGLNGQVDSFVVRLMDIGAAETLNLATTNFIDWENGVDTIEIQGTAQGDTIIGTRFNDTIRGGRDGLGGGDDLLRGSLGDDVLYGGNNNDTLIGGLGDDILDGGANTDTADYSDAATSGNGIGVTVSLAIQGVAQNTKFMGVDTLIGIENIIGTRNGDTLTGDGNVNVLTGGTGNDTLQGGAGGDTLDGGAGIDTLSYANSSSGVTVNIGALTATGGDATGDTILVGFENITGSAGLDRLTGTSVNNVLLGGGGNDVLSGAAGNDTLNGGADNDNITGGAGVDTMTGGNGNDRFYYNATTEGSDLVTDFSNGVGNNDSFYFDDAAFGGLPLGALAANRFEANAAGVATTIDARFIYETDTGILRYDADGNGGGAAVEIARLSAAPTITVADFFVF